MEKFRKLRADEIECRISSVFQNGVSVLLYKDARCDMNILDETVGMMNWKRSHCRENANCIVSIWDEDKAQWISKEDTGTESNTEKEKGLASDSFKRACFNWGIGRELYTAPRFIFIGAEHCKITPKGNGFTCKDRFYVSDIGYDSNDRINKLVIVDKSGKQVYRFLQEIKDTGTDKGIIKQSHINTLRGVYKKNGISETKVNALYGLSRIEEMNINQFTGIMNHVEEFKIRCGE